MKKDRSTRHEAVCAVCSRPFAPAESALREGEGMVHVDCGGPPPAAPGSEDRTE
jgi:hypothetical protein